MKLSWREIKYVLNIGVWGCITLPLKMLSILSNSVTKLYLSIHAKHHAIWSLTCACKKYPNRVTIISWLHHKKFFSNMGQIWVCFPKCLWPVIPLPWNCPITVKSVYKISMGKTRCQQLRQNPPKTSCLVHCKLQMRLHQRLC